MEEQIKKQKRIFKYVLAVFVAVIIIADVCLIIMHNKTFSETENRMLQQVPTVSVSNLLSGKFMSQAEDFVSDQFPLRDKWIALKLRSDKIIGKQLSNGVILGKEGYLIENSVEPLPSFTENLNAIVDFSNLYSDLNIVMTIVPNAVTVCDHLLPDNIQVRSQSEDFKQAKNILANGSLTFVDLNNALSARKTEYIYYKSDHHWTSLGAKISFEDMADELGIEEVIEPQEQYTVCDDFSGTMASTSGDFNVKDSIDIYTYNMDDFAYVVEYSDEQRKTATIFNSAALEQKNKYEVFLGGNHPQINIKTTNLNKKNLLIFKDSYANCFVQFLLPYYQSITIIDPRYFSDDADKIIADSNITDVLFLYNMNTFAADNSLAGVLFDE